MCLEVQNNVKRNEKNVFKVKDGYDWLYGLISFCFRKKQFSSLWECGRWSVLRTEQYSSWPLGLFWKQLCDCKTRAVVPVMQIGQRWGVAHFHNKIGPKALCHQVPNYVDFLLVPGSLVFWTEVFLTVPTGFLKKIDFYIKLNQISYINMK